MRFCIAASAATLLLAQAALAQNPSSDTSQMAGAEPDQSTAQAQQAKVERTLAGAGFTDVEIMPTAFLVRAKNPEGQRVIMVVDPISLTASVIENSRSAPDDTTTGMAHPK
jgi:NH3-dependent NAD+ synthetase